MRVEILRLIQAVKLNSIKWASSSIDIIDLLDSLPLYLPPSFHPFQLQRVEPIRFALLAGSIWNHNL
ncbi:hypothetical protein AXF42_Ash002590 [Apostasia shenzhenica]|uniref:Uncharacterized protein n=1 Tax=Apostasia shenzhenica TaxID=1088818 RepID=A0A2I0AP85_9ASPA|nr:hypothetical protein AXF42_Ash002590 [Apostasia shenzhenica]